ncbi:PITH domain-containing protein 1 [Gracilariopsis chorda]|uniref:PITH domain-containing protein 1 n=1 Tax=Gracilariopsis chorda TaxID=448386 RepID=A0A2V3IZJ9_9FLOR|nr:PITH domain-containing protein 1 [Gracilariopsis chorda]|eukprot:PXF47586.1 PITH domain-containing protein 1 [Gracilariopsis chorda]
MADGRHGHTCSHAHHDHDHDEDGGGEAWALFEQVNTEALICLNEADPDSLKHVLRPWYKRCDPSLPTLKSDADEQLLMCIPFVSPVKIKSICIIGAGGGVSPSHMKAYINDEVLDFSSVASKRPIQEWDLIENNIDGMVDYPTKYTRFQNVSKLWLFVDTNFGADLTEIMYIGLKGEYTKYKREAVNTVYESRPLKASEDVKNTSNMPSMGM